MLSWRPWESFLAAHPTVSPLASSPELQSGTCRGLCSHLSTLQTSGPACSRLPPSPAPGSLPFPLGPRLHQPLDTAASSLGLCSSRSPCAPRGPWPALPIASSTAPMGHWAKWSVSLRPGLPGVLSTQRTLAPWGSHLGPHAPLSCSRGSSSTCPRSAPHPSSFTQPGCSASWAL